METMTKKNAREEALTRLREWLPEGSTVWTILRRTSRSGMFRRISPLAFVNGEPRHMDYNAALALKINAAKIHGGDGVPVSGCGMDMGFHLVESLSYALYGKGNAFYHRWL